MKSPLLSAVLAMGLALPVLAVPDLLLPASAQTANGDPTTAAPPVLPGTPRPVTRTAPSVGRGGAKLPVLDNGGLPKPTKAELAEQRKLEHDMRICIGC